VHRRRAAQPGLADTVSAATGRTVLVPANPVLAAPDGATRAPAPGPAAAANRVAPAGRGRWLRLLAGPFLLGGASLALLTRAMFTADTHYVNTFISWVDLPTEERSSARGSTPFLVASS
jgi:hypothetical protein